MSLKISLMGLVALERKGRKGNYAVGGVGLQKYRPPWALACPIVVHIERT